MNKKTKSNLIMLTYLGISLLLVASVFMFQGNEIKEDIHQSDKDLHPAIWGLIEGRDHSAIIPIKIQYYKLLNGY